MSILSMLVADRRSARPRRLVVVLGLAVVAGLAPTASSAASPEAPDGGLRPTIHYEDALEHASDRLTFAPGGRVSVAYTPRRGDRWLVGGRSPRALPAGRQSGREMRGVQLRLPVDQPTVDPAAVIPARDMAWRGNEPPTVDLAAAVDAGALRREVFGFLPYWELSDSSTRLDWEKISTLAYFGVGADSKGNLIKKNKDGSTTVGWSGWTSSRMTGVIDAAHRSHARVVLTVQSFAWSSTGVKRQKALLGSASARANLARQIAAAVRDRGADGVNLDFEPIASGYADEFTALVRKVRSTLDKAHKGYQLTFDTTGWIGNYPIEDATKPGGADAIFVMGYDYRSSGSNPVGSIAPIGGSTYDVRDTIKAYLDRVPASKLILGVPYYGRAWSTSSSKLHARNRSGVKYGPSTSAVYATARAIAADHGRKYDATEGVAWTAYKRETCTRTHGCVTGWRQLYYDDARALKAKYDLVNGYDLRGIGIWALGYDGTRPELYQAIKDKFITDTVPPVITSAKLTSPVISPNGDGRLDATTASLKVTGLVDWGYSVQPMSGTKAGKAIRTGRKTGKSPTFTWNGKDGSGDIARNGTYRITLWAADVSGNRASKRFTVVLDTKKAKLTATTGAGFFSPDRDRHNDTVPLAWTANEPFTGSVRIRDRKGGTVRTWLFSAKPGWAKTWTGADAKGRIVDDGRYTVRVDGRDAAGNRTVVDRPVLVDRTIKSVRWSAMSFDPRAKGSSRATIVLRRAARLTVAVYRGDTRVRTVWTDKAVKTGSVAWTWNGKTTSGAYAKPGAYRIVVVATSRYGTTRYSKGVTVEPH